MAEVLGQEIWQKVEPEFRNALKGHSSVLEFQNQQTSRYIRLAMTPETSEGEIVRGAYILSTDVTSEVQTRSGLAHARRRELASQLTSAMSHDFSNLLTIIMGQQLLLEQDPHLSDAAREASATISSAANRGAELIESLNRLSPTRDINTANVKISEFQSQLESLVRATLPETFSLHIHTKTPDSTLIFDPGFAQDAVLNMVINSVEACGGSGRIELTIHKSPDGWLEFLACDDGPGFSEEALAQAINPFYSTKTGKAGRGLGLTSAYDFAKSCGGFLTLSNQTDLGALVSLKVPYQPHEKTGNGIILLVDDDDEIRKTLRSQLRSAGHSVIEASSVEEASKLADVDGLSLIITDLAIAPDGTGLQVAQSAPQNVPVLIITGLPNTDPLRIKAEALHRVWGKHVAVNSLGKIVDEALL